MTDPQVSAATRRWWGTFELEAGRTMYWRIGPLGLWVRRTETDLRYGASSGDESLEQTLEVCVPVESSSALSELPAESARFGYARTEKSLELVPRLADRPVVARPTFPFFVPPGQKVELFVSTPLWVLLRAAKNDLAESSCVRPSDTWFGTNTRGVLSYATRSTLRRNLENVPVRPHRAVTSLLVENSAEKNLRLERLSLPVPQLSLFATENGDLWTERVTVKNEEGDDPDVVTLEKSPPRSVGPAKRVSQPRTPQGRSFGSLVFGGLFDTKL